MKFSFPGSLYIVILTIALLFFLIHFYFAPSQNTITVFAAASLTEAFSEMGEAFEDTLTDTEVVFNFAGSQKLACQIKEGAPADIFASASEKEMRILVKEGIIESEQPVIFAENSLVLITSKEMKNTVKSLRDLKNPGLKVVLAHETVPVGYYSFQMFDSFYKSLPDEPDFKDKLTENIVSLEDNVKSVLAKVVIGEGDAGIVYRTDAAGEVSRKIGVIEIPEEFNQTAFYPVSIINNSSNKEGSHKFIKFILSKKGRNILKKYKFITVD